MVGWEVVQNKNLIDIRIFKDGEAVVSVTGVFPDEANNLSRQLDIVAEKAVRWAEERMSNEN